MKHTIRKALVKDAEAIRSLFYETVQAVDKTLYTETQLQKWVAVYADESKWMHRLANHYYLVAVNEAKKIIGFCSLKNNGCVDMLYTHPAYQKQGVAQALLYALYDVADEKHITKLFTNTSLVATPFFEKHGFVVQQINDKNLDGVCFAQIVMDKRLWLV
ncbi:MAG TPA: GNAT family N-acetyltransferase [Bacteroidia bacterium]|nr:GNAT family N-acetyltransferase [Bacteroidia bacterium]